MSGSILNKIILYYNLKHFEFENLCVSIPGIGTYTLWGVMQTFIYDLHLYVLPWKFTFLLYYAHLQITLLYSLLCHSTIIYDIQQISLLSEDSEILKEMPQNLTFPGHNVWFYRQKLTRKRLSRKRPIIILQHLWHL